MSHFEDIERPLYASELFKSFKLNIITNHRSNFLSSEKLDERVSFEGRATFKKTNFRITLLRSCYHTALFETIFLPTTAIKNIKINKA
jgi:hypothetical protein